MGPLIREARPEERPDVARQWHKSFATSVPGVKHDGAWYVPIGAGDGEPIVVPDRHGNDRTYVPAGTTKILRALWIKAHRLLVEHLVEHDSVAVAVVDDEVIGWVCHNADTVHFVWVIEAAEKTDLRRRLFSHASAARKSHIVPRRAA